jgi:uncharacterized protein YciI
MFVTTLTYMVELDQIEAAMPEHIAWLDGQYAAGVVVMSGRRVPRVGGVIVWHGIEQSELEVRIASDPFVARGLATVAIVAFRPTRAGEGFAALIEQG